MDHDSRIPHGAAVLIYEGETNAHRCLCIQGERPFLLCALVCEYRFGESSDILFHSHFERTLGWMVTFGLAKTHVWVKFNKRVKNTTADGETGL